MLPKTQEGSRIFNTRPWLFENQLMVLEKLKEDVELSNNVFTKSLLWVQVWNLPIHWLSKEAGLKIGKVFNSVEEKGVDEPQFESWLKAGTGRHQTNSVKTPIIRIAENVKIGKNGNQERVREDDSTNPRIATTQENDALGPDQRNSKNNEGQSAIQVQDTSVCKKSIITISGKNEEGKEIKMHNENKEESTSAG
ncbi:hypothetical protein ACH5RR_022102 [Cinchona calisaya]|uniref:DUF4283 domain-containing protein n=1 Tax=Cinchona calisaya TaxID=153742 RepID=A0ABD2ZA53_9GENT